MTDTSHRDTSSTSQRDTSTSTQATAARPPDAARRRFLLAFGAGAAGAASASALAAAPGAVVAPAEPQPVSQGYRETEHVRNYYATARL